MKEKKTADLVGSVIGNIIGIVFVNTVLLWRQYTNGVVLESWIDILWAANLSLIVQIVGNILLAMYRPARLYSLLQAVDAALGFVSILVFYFVFPLDFSRVAGDWLNTLTKAALIVAMAGTTIGMVVHLARAASGAQYASVVTEQDGPAAR
jgi:hypothetical protein